MIVLDEQIILDFTNSRKTEMIFRVFSHDREDVFTVFSTNSQSSTRTMEALIVLGSASDGVFSRNDIHSYKVIVIIQKCNCNSHNSDKNLFVSDSGDTYSILSYRMNNSEYTEDIVVVVPVKDELFSRIDGLFETGVLSKKKVAIIGLGSGGSPSALDLIKSGVQNFILIDNDRLEIGNITRHVCGISDLGRYKTLAVKDKMLDKNPYANILTLEEALSWNNKDKIYQLIKDVDLVICATDNRESKIIINKICIENDIVCFYAGAFRRAYGGQVLRVRPNKSICFQCFLDMLPGFAEDIEISNDREAQKIQYSDTMVPIEPGLSIDILPISTFVSRLAILELLRFEEHSFKSLYDDFVADFYLWLNRRDAESQFEDLEPLEYNLDGLHIMRWYGFKTEKSNTCPVCGSPDNWKLNM